jgi:hypothetical protein
MKLSFFVGVILSLGLTAAQGFAADEHQSTIHTFKQSADSTCENADSFRERALSVDRYTDEGRLVLAVSNSAEAMCNLLKSFVSFREGENIDVGSVCALTSSTLKETRRTIRLNSGADFKFTQSATQVADGLAKGFRTMCIGSWAPGSIQRMYWKVLN